MLPTPTVLFVKYTHSSIDSGSLRGIEVTKEFQLAVLYKLFHSAACCPGLAHSCVVLGIGVSGEYSGIAELSCSVLPNKEFTCSKNLLSLDFFTATKRVIAITRIKIMPMRTTLRPCLSLDLFDDLFGLLGFNTVDERSLTPNEVAAGRLFFAQ